MSTSTTFDLLHGGGLARALLRLQAFANQLARDDQRVDLPEASAELLRIAARYEDSQPSYAADLRAAALVHEREDGQR